MLSLTGVVHGRTIKLSSDPGLAEGERVEVTLKQTARTSARPAAEAHRGLEWSDDDDRILAEIAQDRAIASARDVAP